MNISFPGCAPHASAPMTIQTVAPAPVVRRSETTPLDINSLETRLHEPRAVGVFTRISLGNQVNDGLDQFRAYHSYRTQPPTPKKFTESTA